MNLNLTLLYFVWNEEHCQTSPDKNKSPNLWHITSILVYCIFDLHVVVLLDLSNDVSLLVPIGRVKDEDVIDYADEETDGDSAVFEDEWLNSATMLNKQKLIFCIYCTLDYAIIYQLMDHCSM